MEQVRLDIKEENYAVLTLQRSAKMNAVTRQMTRELKEALDQVSADHTLKFLVITGGGERAFCTGGDLHEFHGGMSADEAYNLLRPMMEVLHQLATMPIPVIALLNGQARGGGCEIATACDFRYGRKEAKYGFVQGNLGITPGWGGGTLLYQRITPGNAAHWLMDAEMYEAERTLHIGWLHKISSLEDIKGLKDIHPFLNKTAAQMRVFKKQLLKESFPEDLYERMEEEVRLCSNLWETEEHKLAVEKFMSTRKKL
ncbi:MAG: enoyl-CoA hydratase/isomerase family protein [Halobacillus sp.]|uniref:enoyl-CoA hydratase/isomerase family protein n=1 Tax=Halobacillus sp. TaxID=56800 RepID=UPI003BB1469E